MSCTGSDDPCCSTNVCFLRSSSTRLTHNYRNRSVVAVYIIVLQVWYLLQPPWHPILVYCTDRLSSKTTFVLVSLRRQFHLPSRSSCRLQLGCTTTIYNLHSNYCCRNLGKGKRYCTTSGLLTLQPVSADSRSPPPSPQPSGYTVPSSIWTHCKNKDISWFDFDPDDILAFRPRSFARCS